MIKDIEQLIQQPRESLSVEIKGWLDINDVYHQAKIIKTLIALRNFNGGYLIIGFNDETYEQEENAPEDVETLYHPDTIQGWIGKYASEAFEIEYAFPERNGIKHPVFIVTGGVKNVVATKADLKDQSGKNIIEAHKVYCRTLSSNNTPSTSSATWKDWPKIIDVCFDNREADIGNFLRRHLGVKSADKLSEIITMVNSDDTQNIDNFHTASMSKFEEIVNERQIDLPKHGYWAVSLLIKGQIPPQRANKDFLRMLDASNPRYTGWPVWRNTENSNDKDRHPFVDNHIWESLVVDLGNGFADHIDYQRLDPKGLFFLRRALQDDVGGSDKAPPPLTALDFGLVILRVAEVLSVGISFAKAMDCEPETTSLLFKFEWGHLKDRELCSWADWSRSLSYSRKAYQDNVVSTLEMPLETPISSLGEFVKIAIDPLFEVFDGFVISSEVVNDMTNKLISRRL